jgi:hypothetical protein
MEKSGVVGLREIPLVAVGVGEHHRAAVRFLARLLGKPDAARLHTAVVVPEIVGVQEQEDAPPGLIPDVGQLL